MLHKINWRQYLNFSFVGSIGFIIDAGVLYLLIIYLAFHPISGRIISFLLASTVTWSLNRKLTFKKNRNSAKIFEWLHYLFANSIGTIINLATYSTLVLTVHAMLKQPVYALIIASLVAFPFNYYGYKNHVFKVDRF